MPRVAREAADLADVLRDPAIGAYDVTIVEDESAHTIRSTIERFCRALRIDDIALVHLSCHGLQDSRGNLHYAATDTDPSLLASTGVSSTLLNDQLEDSRCRRQVLMLDCCYSGAFARGARGILDPALPTRFTARGLVVLTASGATQLAYEGVFTDALVHGMRSGDADRDGDGLITATELFHYAETIAGASEQRQRPTLSIFGGEGEIVVAHNPHAERTARPSLAPAIEERLRDGKPAERIAAVTQLAELLGTDLDRLARDELKRVAATDIALVKDFARRVLRDDASRKAQRRRLMLAAAVGLVAATATALVIATTGSPHGATPDRAEQRTQAGTAADGLSATTPVTVGAMYPNDTNSDVSKETVAGEILATEYVNDPARLGLKPPLRGGSHGLPRLAGAPPLQLVHVDSGDRCQAEKRTLDALVDRHHAVAILGAYESTITLRAMVAAQRRGVPLVNESSSAASLTQPAPAPRLRPCDYKGPEDHRPGPRDPRTSKWFFRAAPSDAQAAERFMSFIEAMRPRTPDPPRIAILHESNDIFGNAASRATKVLAEQRGWPVAEGKYRTVRGAKEVPCAMLRPVLPRVAAIKAFRPDVVFLASYEPDAIMIVQAMAKLGVQPEALLAFGAGFLSQAFLDRVRKPHCGLPGADPSGIVVRASWSAANAAEHPVSKAVAAAFDRRFGHPMDSRSATGYTAMMTLAMAINDSRSRDREKIRAALQRLDVPGASTIMPWGGVDFDASGQNAKAAVVLQQIVGGRYLDVYPPSVTSRHAIWPLSGARAKSGRSSLGLGLGVGVGGFVLIAAAAVAARRMRAPRRGE